MPKAPPMTQTVGSYHYVDHEPSELFAILNEHLSENAKGGNKKDIGRLDEILYNMYSDLSALHQINSMVQLHRPRFSRRTIGHAVQTENGKAWRYIRAGYFDINLSQIPMRMKTINPGKEELKAAYEEQTICYAMTQFLQTPKPIGSRATQKWLDRDQAQRAASSRLWEKMRLHRRIMLENLDISSDYIKEDLGVLSADQAPEYISLVQAERAAILARIAAKNIRKPAPGPSLQPEVQTQWGPRQTDLNIADEAPEPSQEKVAVTKRSLEVLQSLFPNPNFEERTKQVPWVSFVRAMNEVGFAATQSHGSEYSFEPIPTSKWYGRGEIVCHKPHPEAEYEAWRLLGIGKRMEKWFGWSAETFELLRAKPTAERE